MGIDYYTVIPKLKILIQLGRNIHEDYLEDDEKALWNFLSIWSNYHYEGDIPEIAEIKNKKLKDFKIEDLMSITFYISKIDDFISLQNSPDIIIRYSLAKSIDKKAYIISDVSEKLDKLKKKKYKLIEEDENQ